MGWLDNKKHGQNGPRVSNREFSVSNQGVPFTMYFIGPNGSGPFWCFSIAPRNDFEWVGQIKTKVNGAPCFGAENARFEPGIFSFKPEGAVYLVFRRSTRLRSVLVFFDRAPSAPK